MLEFLAPAVQTYPEWTLFGLFGLALAIIEAVPATARALRGRPKCKCEKKEGSDV
jgi:hypothetical protein